MRFVPPLALLADGPVAFDGDAQAYARPMEPLLGALRDLGAEVTADGDGDGLPFTLTGRPDLAGGMVTLDASTSSQFVSGLLLVGARYAGGLDVRHDGQPVPSLPHIAMTVAMLRERGVEVDDSRARPLGGRARPDRPARRGRRARPLQRRPVPGRRRGHRRFGTGAELAAPDLQPGDQLRGILAVFGAEVTLTRRRTGRPGHRSAARGRPRPARGERADAGGRRRRRAGPTTPATSAASRTSAATRPTGSPRSGPSSRRWARGSHETHDGLTIHPRLLPARPSAPTPTTGWRRPAR